MFTLLIIASFTASVCTVTACMLSSRLSHNKEQLDGQKMAPTIVARAAT
jgi:hypothetical protein